MNTVDFIKKHNLHYQPIRIDDRKRVTGPVYQEDSKKVYPKCNDSLEVCNDRIKTFGFQTDHFAIHSSKSLAVIDVDVYEPGEEKYQGELSEEAEEWIEKMKEILPWTKSTSKKRGIHLYFKPSKDVRKFLKQKCRHPDFPFKQIEILSGSFVYEKRDKKFYNVKETIPMIDTPLIPYDFVTKPKSEENVKIEVTKKKKKSKVDKAVDALTAQQADLPRDKWMPILSQIKFHGEKYKEQAREWSKKSSRYKNDKDFDTTWDYLTPMKPLVKSLPDEDSEEIYLEFDKLWGDNYIINHHDGKPTYYIYDEKNKIWKNDNGLNFLKHKILKVMRPIYEQSLIDNCNDDNEEEATSAKKKLTLLNKINGGGINDIAKLFIINKADPSIENVDFDAKEHLYHFKNHTLDLNTMRLEKRVKEDYVTMVGCEFKLIEDFDKRQEAVEFWDNLLTDVFPIEEEKENWVHLMCNSFSGKVLERFIIENGTGSNGKSFLNDVLRYIHQDYAFKGNVSILTKKIGDNGNPAIANMDKKRFCIFDEPCEEDTIEFSVIKTMTGSNIINARKLFSNDTKCTMAGVKLLECNEKLKLSGNTGNSMSRRAIDILYRNQFKLEQEIPKNNTQTNIKIARPEYKTKEWLDKNASGLIYYFLKFMIDKNLTFTNLEKVTLCDSIKERTKNYIEDSNDILQIVLTYCNYTTEEEFTKISDIHNKFKNSSDFQNLTKKEKRKLGKLNFQKLIQRDPQLKDFYINEHNGTTGWLKNYKSKVDEDSDEECII
jgi:hypothetical protein